MKVEACAVCGLPERDQHSNKQSAICDGIRNGKLPVSTGQALVKKLGFTTKNK